MKALALLRNLTIRCLELTLIGLVAILVLDVSWQVITRYLLGRPSTWTDELATLLMIWVASLGAGLGFRQKAHLGIDYMVTHLSPKGQFWTEIATQLVVFVFAVSILVYGGIHLVSLTLATNQVSPALGMRMGWVYLALPVSGLFIAWSALDQAAERWSEARNERTRAK